MNLTAKQITFGPRHHFFGYIGHSLTIPWNSTGQFIALLETDFQDRMPTASDPASILLLDAQNNFDPRKVDESRAWNPQQGTMLFWNPARPNAELFFNDRDQSTGEVFTVLFDIESNRRIREFRFPGTPVANGGVAPSGKMFAAINYGRLARLRPVTGYPEAADWTQNALIPSDDGVFIINTQTGKRDLICSLRRIADTLLDLNLMLPADHVNIFLNHTLWNRESDLLLFYARSGPMWGTGHGKNLNCAFTVRPDGSDLTCHGKMGGHTEWDLNSKILAEHEGEIRLYDPLQKRYLHSFGNPALFPDPTGDKALSSNADWLVHGNCIKSPHGQSHQYVLYRRSDNFHLLSPLFPRGPYTEGSLRLDAAPCWNRDGTQILLPAIAPDGSRQSFLLQIA